jgi:hypothetical protein
MSGWCGHVRNHGRCYFNHPDGIPAVRTGTYGRDEDGHQGCAPAPATRSTPTHPARADSTTQDTGRDGQPPSLSCLVFAAERGDTRSAIECPLRPSGTSDSAMSTTKMRKTTGYHASMMYLLLGARGRCDSRIDTLRATFSMSLVTREGDHLPGSSAGP